MKHFLAATFLGVMAAGGAYAEGPVDVTNVNKELITSADDLQNAWAAALSKEPEGWKALAPGQERPFMVVFPRAAAGLESEAFRVEFTPPVVTSDGR